MLVRLIVVLLVACSLAEPSSESTVTGSTDGPTTEPSPESNVTGSTDGPTTELSSEFITTDSEDGLTTEPSSEFNTTDSGDTLTTVPSSDTTDSTVGPTTPAKHLLCYHCATTNEDDSCIHNTSKLLDTSMHGNKEFYKDCTAANPSWTRCMIETMEFHGNLVVFHRGCHGGKMFGDNQDSVRFHDLLPSNYSTCDQIGNNLVCFRFCDTNWCNGPQPPENETCRLVRDDFSENATCDASAMYFSNGWFGVEMLWVFMLSLLQLLWVMSPLF